MSIDCLVDALDQLRSEAKKQGDQRWLWSITAIENVFKKELINKNAYAKFVGQDLDASSEVLSLIEEATC